ncbi:MAG: hypothetical protein IT435_15930 [Phycisphaerales bacterium]|nr:hypothetical protein [Phycisphaerales bacterium]
MGKLGRAFMHELVRVIAENRLDRFRIANGLGMKPHTFTQCMAPSSPACFRMDHAIDLLVREDLLSAPARDRLAEWLLREMGRVTVDAGRADAQDAPLAQQLLELHAAGGDLASAVRTATSASSAGGQALTIDEVMDLLARAMHTQREVNELVATLAAERDRLNAR